MKFNPKAVISMLVASAVAGMIQEVIERGLNKKLGIDDESEKPAPDKPLAIETTAQEDPELQDLRELENECP